MNSFFQWLHVNEHTSELFKIPRMKEEKKVLRSFSEAELKKIITYKPKGFSRTRLHTILLTLIDTGCRIEEILTLRRENVDLENLLIKVMGKGSKERIVPISFELRKVLYKYLQKHRWDLVFPSSAGTQTNYQNLHRDAQELFKELNVLVRRLISCYGVLFICSVCKGN